MNLNDQTAAALKKTRERRGVKVADLSEAMDLSLDALYRLESGKTGLGIRHIESAAERLGMTPRGLLSELASEVEKAHHERG